MEQVFLMKMHYSNHFYVIFLCCKAYALGAVYCCYVYEDVVPITNDIK